MEQHFGLLRHDGTPKLQFQALKSLIALFSDRGAAFTPGSLRDSLTGDLTGIRTSLFQKRDGRFYPAIWQGVDSFDLKANTDIEPPLRKVTLTFTQAVSSPRTFLPTFDGTAVQDVYNKPKTLSLSVPDHVLVVEITLPKRKR